MAKLIRYAQQVFGSTAGIGEMAEYGAFAAGFPGNVYDGATINPDIVQQLGNYLQGWVAAVAGADSPGLEDLNSLCYLYARQLAYLMQTGIPEWNATTDYYIGSVAQDTLGNIYISKTDGNTNNALTSTVNWTAPGVPSNFNVGVGGQTGLVVSTITNTSTGAGTDGSVLKVVSGDSSGVGTSSLDLERQKDGSSYLANQDVAGIFDLKLKVAGGALTPVMRAQNNGTVDFPFNMSINGFPAFSKIFTYISSNLGANSLDLTAFPYFNRIHYFYVEICGGGGGGGASQAITANQSRAAGGGGGAATCSGWFPVSTTGTLLSWVIGAGGAGAVTSATDGTDGTASVFLPSTLQELIAGGGGGGQSDTGGSAVGGTGGVPSGPGIGGFALGIVGGYGFCPTFYLNSTTLTSAAINISGGHGGSSYFGGGASAFLLHGAVGSSSGDGLPNTNPGGNLPTGQGAGGSGGAAISSASPVPSIPGGYGREGIIRLVLFGN